jgi:hypothetical protein
LNVVKNSNQQTNKSWSERGATIKKYFCIICSQLDTYAKDPQPEPRVFCVG